MRVRRETNRNTVYSGFETGLWSGLNRIGKLWDINRGITIYTSELKEFKGKNVLKFQQKPKSLVIIFYVFSLKNERKNLKEINFSETGGNQI